MPNSTKRIRYLLPVDSDLNNYADISARIIFEDSSGDVAISRPINSLSGSRKYLNTYHAKFLHVYCVCVCVCVLCKIFWNFISTVTMHQSHTAIILNTYFIFKFMFHKTWWEMRKVFASSFVSCACKRIRYF